MSEEKILKECNQLFVTMANCHINGKPMADLLALYEKEKEKNKELEENLKVAVAMLTKGTYPEKNKGDNDFNKKFIAVDKIKEKIEELEKEYKEYENSPEWEIFDETKYAYGVLKELLEEV